MPSSHRCNCRQELRESVEIAREAKEPLWLRCLDSLGFRPTGWSMRIAMASLLVCLGFGLSRLSERWVPAPDFTGQMALIDPLRAHVRMIEQGRDDRVQVVIDEIREHVVSGTPSDPVMRRFLLAALRDPSDPAVRVDSLEVLKEDAGTDVRDTLLDVAQHDSNSGVRLKAIAALERFVEASETRRILVHVLSHDECPDVRSEAIDLLVASGDKAGFSPQLTETLQTVMRSDPDGYVRMRCQRALQASNVPVKVY
jgi:HEAT repeats